MKNTKRRPSILLAGTLLLGLFAACAQLPPLVPDDLVVEEGTAAISGYDFGQERTALSAFEARQREATTVERAPLETQLFWILQHPESTFAGRQFACRMLRRIGSERAVFALEGFLDDEEMAHPARFALEGLPSPRADEALRDALARLDGELRLGVIDSIAARGDRGAVSKLAKLFDETDAVTVHAALEALGRIGGKKAARALDAAEVGAEHAAVLTDARLQCADSLVAEGAVSAATKIYLDVRESAPTVAGRIAAWRGWLRAHPDDAPAAIGELLEDADPAVRRAAGSFVAELPLDADVTPLAEGLAKREPATRILLLELLAARGADAAAEPALAALEAGTMEVRIAGMRALAEVGSAEHVTRIAWFAGRTGPEGKVAVHALGRLDAPGVDEAIAGCLVTLPDPAKAALVPLLAKRGMPDAPARLIRLASDGGAPVRRACLESLAEICDVDDVDQLLGLLLYLEEDADRRKLEAAIIAAHQHGGDDAATVATIERRLDAADGSLRASYLRLLGAIPTERSLERLLASVSDPDATVHLAAIDALVAWPDDGPLETLGALARDGENEVVRSLSLRGYLRLLAGSDTRSSAEIAAAFTEAFAAAKGPEEKMAVVESVRAARAPWGVGVLRTLADDTEVGAQAGAAGGDLESGLARSVPHAAQARRVKLTAAPVERYDPGLEALVDGKWGSTAHGDGTWHGFEGTDLEVVIDLESSTEISTIRVGYLRNSDSWIFPPATVEFSISEDGETYETVGIVTVDLPSGEEKASVTDAWVGLDGKSARFVRVLARNGGPLPAWHPGTGEKAWLFIDEIQVNPNYGE